MASLISATIFFSLVFLSNANAHPKQGFTVDLIHRDSPKSPFYNPSQTSSQRIRNAIRRSVLSNYDNSPSPNSPQSTITSYSGEYLMNISIGTPPFPILAIADTASDLIWTQCNPCKQCFKQKVPLFNPQKSSTYRNLPCSSRQCRSVESSSCSATGKTCSYSLEYGDKSHTRGAIAVDTMTLGSTDRRHVSLPNVIFGCGHNNIGNFDENGSGIIGLGGGSTSLISQLGKSIDGKFSYCLIPLTSGKSTSKINFGKNGVVSGRGVVSTPLVNKRDAPTFYLLTLEAISVGNTRIPFSGSVPTKEGNIIIASGTTLTMLPSRFYSKLESAVASTIKAKRVQDPQRVLSLCYGSSSIKVPELTVHFKGADVKLGKVNTFASLSEDLYCFAFAPNDQGAIYGNLVQTNFLVGYDTVSRTVSFKMTDCARM